METSETDINIPVTTFATGWQTALARPPRVDVVSQPTQIDRPRVLSVNIRPPMIKTLSFAFPEAPEWGQIMAKGSQGPAKPATSVKRPKSHRSTRIKPPSDTIKLQDRLYYVLQPSLESIVSTACLEFPFEPFPYQFEGIAFLYPRHSAVLADEMGLGKTMQAISTIRLLLYAREVRSVLLICPKPLVTNWQREFRLWAPEIPLAIIEGDKDRRQWQWREPLAPVKIANYELLMRDQELLLDPQLHFDLVLLDEAQRIKNRSSTTSQVARSVSRTRSWALTGTPIENSTDDLVGIFEFLSPGFLSNGMAPRTIARNVQDHILRRTKDLVLNDMPPKLFRDADLALTPEQQETYSKAEDDGILQLNSMGEGITIQHVFELVLRLKQICNFDPASGASCKLERLEADLEEVAASGKKAIVFSQWVRTLHHIRGPLARFNPLEYHGQIPSKRRDPILQQFKEDPSSHVLLMSYGAGSVGLNLQFCEYVFLFDRWWNPAVEDQAINRAHRIGVTGPVTVTRMLVSGTIEERINQVLEEKRELFDSIFSNTAAPASAGLSQDEIFGLFNLKMPSKGKAA